MDTLERIYSFQTANFKIVCDIFPDHDVDLSFDETGETAEKIASGEYTAFTANVKVTLRGNDTLLGEDYLSGCIRANPSDFIDHRGINKMPGCGSYFSDMVREAIKEARAMLEEIQEIKLKGA